MAPEPPEVRKANTETPAALFRSLGGWTGAGAISPMAPCLMGVAAGKGYETGSLLGRCDSCEDILYTSEGNVEARKLKWSERF